MRRATVFMGVPHAVRAPAAEPGLTKEGAKNMRLFVAGSAPLLIETFNDWQQRTGHTILERYGRARPLLTSTPTQLTHAWRPDERRGATVALRCRAWACAWWTMPTSRCRGEIRRHPGQGPNVFKATGACPRRRLKNSPPAGSDLDVGKVDERDYVSIVGRSKDLIISGGYNVYPAEIEATSTTCRRGRKRAGRRAPPGLWRGGRGRM